ncbi:MAG: SpoIIE family protein phosphatase [Flavobacteriales bacterium]
MLGALHNIGMNLAAITPRISMVLVLVLMMLNCEPLVAQDELVIEGYAMQQSMEDAEGYERPASDVTINIYDDDGLFFTEQTGISGSFYFKLPLGTDYFVEWVKPGLTSKRMLFNLIGVEDGDLKRSDLNFAFDIGLIESTFLTNELKNEGGVTQISWSKKKKEWVYDNKQSDDYWERFADLQQQYEVAKKNAKSNRVGRVLFGAKDKVVWPEDPGDSLDIFVLDDYSTFVQMKILQQQEEEYAKSDVSLIEGLEDLKKKQRYKKPDILFATAASGISSEELMEVVEDKSLLITEGYGVSSSMINIESSLTDTKIQINDIEFVKRGFVATAELRQEAETTIDKDEWANVLADAQQTLKTEKERANKIELQKKSLEVMNQGLFRAKGELDSALRFKSLEVDMLESNIANKAKELDKLNAVMNQRNKQLTEAQKLFDQRQADLERTVAVLENKEKKLLEFDEILASTYDEIKKQEANLSEVGFQLADQKKLNAFIAGALGLITLLLVWAYRNYRKQKKYALENQKQAERIEVQRMQLKEKNTELNDSINYAKRIQEAMLPAITDLNSMVKDSFIIYEPKDVVAGDFFWIQKKDETVYFAVADCTGHGVPGAMMSVVCYNALNRALRELGSATPAQLLDLTRKYVVEQVASATEDVKDGMDIAMCSWNPITRKLQFAGAQNPLWIVTRNEIQGHEPVTIKSDDQSLNVYEIKGDKQPIGLYEFATQFENYEVSLKDGDTVYIFSDGYADQFGGKNGKKMKYSLFRELVVLSGKDACETQREFLSEYFLNWRGELEQIDDVCVMGVRV